MASKKPAPKSPKRRNHHLANIIEQNIHTIANNRKADENKRTTEDRIADAITSFSGSMRFVYFHVAWFAIWILANLGLFGIKPLDPFPFGLLTMIVSLEAIFLATFVLISQNRSTADSERRADLDLQMDLLTEHELTRVIKMLDEIQDKLGIENDSDPELSDLEKEVHPEEVLAEIDRIQQRVRQLKK